MIAGGQAQRVARARRQVDLEPGAGVDDGVHGRAFAGERRQLAAQDVSRAQAPGLLDGQQDVAGADGQADRDRRRPPCASGASISAPAALSAPTSRHCIVPASGRRSTMTPLNRFSNPASRASGSDAGDVEDLVRRARRDDAAAVEDDERVRRARTPRGARA